MESGAKSKIWVGGEMDEDFVQELAAAMVRDGATLGALDDEAAAWGDEDALATEIREDLRDPGRPDAPVAVSAVNRHDMPTVRETLDRRKAPYVVWQAWMDLEQPKIARHNAHNFTTPLEFDATFDCQPVVRAEELGRIVEESRDPEHELGLDFCMANLRDKLTVASPEGVPAASYEPEPVPKA